VVLVLHPEILPQKLDVLLPAQAFEVGEQPLPVGGETGLGEVSVSGQGCSSAMAWSP